ncbi:DUF3667 domain-containing protein [uncultured Dokdonia sp.]|uniref:DUF3667 domain-containing protein n=1 Tax=uncultured Dokdonia sp. TaxID=575653 RepID=UPI00262ADB8C|nr:DUF3667 domain-containing protein [uncultured Dokdonia sp.]
MEETLIKSNSRKAIKYRGVECLNCSHPLDLTDRFCSYCGQLNTTKRLTLKDFFSEFALSIFTYDSRFRHTLKDLLFKPGTITRYYVEGKRFHYANPFRFFLSASIVYFIILGFADFVSDDTNNNFQINADPDGVEKGLAIADSIQNQVQKNSDKKIDFSNVEEGINKAILASKKQDSIDNLKPLGSNYEPEDSILKRKIWIEKMIRKGVVFYSFYKKTEIKDPDKALDSMEYGKTKTNIWLYQRNDTYKRIEDDPVRFFKYLSSKTPFFLFFLAPFLGLFFWLIYSNKKYSYMEHLVFIFHIFSFVFICLLLAYIPDALIGQDIFAGILMGIIGPFYFYKALRNFYKQNRVITLIKFVFLNTVYLFLASITALVFFAVTAAFY